MPNVLFQQGFVFNYSMDIRNYYNVNEKFIDELFLLQSELLKLQKHINDEKLRLAILFEGRDTAGKGAAIARFTQFLNPQSYRMVALKKPTALEKRQWYFQRYLKRLPNAGEMIFFDRSWYNRAVVEPAMGFCTKSQYELFMKQVTDLEEMLVDDGMKIVKFWFSIDSIAQKNRIQKRMDSPLERWKVSPVDLAAQDKWSDFTKYKLAMFERTNTDKSPWVIVKGEEREYMRIQAMRYILSLYDYADKSLEVKLPDDGAVEVYKTPNL
ncbi:polyphosphate kinase 2 [Portibacter lacus]|uniref:ADP/GDP-polyphosphate phosphotransferase n=1 Tax=Portibacter lacus TaxID=1099794 RepID=A0AA37SM28_9BACT|nr:polyphosphate kinase 2 [Portibacter lacus]GLR16951.1 polyphosphate kinase 2 [Portibacter lacus]